MIALPEKPRGTHFLRPSSALASECGNGIAVASQHCALNVKNPQYGNVGRTGTKWLRKLAERRVGVEVDIPLCQSQSLASMNRVE